MNPRSYTPSKRYAIGKSVAKVPPMRMPFLALLVLAAACGNADNLIVGGIVAGTTTPDVIFDDVPGAIHGIATQRDIDGNPIGDPMSVVILSNLPDICARLTAKRDYFRNAPEAYEAMVLMVRV